MRICDKCKPLTKEELEEKRKISMENIEVYKKEIVKSLKEIEIDWNWLSNFDNNCEYLHGSIDFLLAIKKRLDEIKGEK